MEGFKLEDRVKEALISAGVFFSRIKTRSTGFKGDTEIADFYAYRYPNLYFFETKSVKGKRLDFSIIRVNQAVGLFEAAKHKGLITGFIAEFREVDSIYFIPISIMEEQLNKGKKSINLTLAEKHKDAIYLGTHKELDLSKLFK